MLRAPLNGSLTHSIMKSACTSKCRPIVVLGAERSGTSVAAAVVHQWGAYAGEEAKIRKGDAENVHGYWEYTPIWDFLAEIGDFKTGASWWDDTFQERVTRKLGLPEYVRKARELLGAMRAGNRPWVWKDPALAFFLPFWKPLWGNPAYLVMVRNPYDTARSWLKFVAGPDTVESPDFIATNLLRWQFMMLLILEHLEDAPAVIFVSYEELVRHPEVECERIGAFLAESCDRADRKRRIHAMAAAIDPALWHNRSRVEFPQIREATEAQKDLYRFLRLKVQTPSVKFDAERYRMPSGWRGLVREQEALIRRQRHEE